MKPLIVLLSVFAVSLLTTKIVRGNFELALSGRIAMSAMLAFTAIGHFAFTKGMAMMLPDFIPFKSETVYLTGIIEIFFFQAEDGIRDGRVTGVQTCALPI